MAKNALITGWGFYAPSRVMTNAELERIVDTSDEWITSRTGIKERRIASDEETNSFMSARAGRAALEKAHLRAQDVQLVVVGDGAGAVVLEASNASVGIESTVLHGDGSKGEMLMVQAGASKRPATAETIERGQHFITMAGGEVFKLAVKSMADAAEEAIAEAGLTLDDIDLLIPHQANVRIIDGVAKRLRFPPEKVFVNIQRYGNTSAASIPIAICEAESTGRLRKGDKVLLVAFGGGFTWGASVLEWFGAHDGVRPLSPLERAGRALEDVVERVRP